jgi:two-component system, sensor histidine kinase and response regulator
VAQANVVADELEVGFAEQANILLVDDRDENLLALEAILEPLGERLWRARSGRDALRELLRRDFALILMDAEMPDMSGFETASIIRQRARNQHTPIIFVTAYAEQGHHMFRSYLVGAVDYIPKPFDPDILRSKVKVFVELHKKTEQVKRQAEMIYQSQLREAERRQREMQEAMEREHMRALNTELEARVEERTAALVAANEEMEAFCYSVSHDLRAPLRAIMATSHILLEDTAEQLNGDQQAQLLRQASAAKRLGMLIDDLLQLSRLGRRSMERKELDVSSIARGIAEELEGRGWDSAAAIKVEPGIVARADEGLTRILMLNLLENACKYSPNGGEIEFGSSNGHFFVRDRGIGFDMQYSDKLFRPFERLVRDSEYEGTGIGLANAQRIVKRHGGRIWAESQPGAGSTFYFTLEGAPAGMGEFI